MERFIFDTSSHTLVCGILNITPDAFSDGGKWDEPQKALEHALEMQALGADIIDAVSYTHLDVYKRQALHTSRIYFLRQRIP